MRWPFRYKGRPDDREGKEMAKRQLEVAKALEESSHELAFEARLRLHMNHFGPNAAKAFQEGHR